MGFCGCGFLKGEVGIAGDGGSILSGVRGQLGFGLGDVDAVKKVEG
jgi:hypothetical protein